MAVFDNGSLTLPRGAVLLADFTDGTHTLSAASGAGDVWYDTGPSGSFATGRAFNLTSDGLMMSFTSATAGQYAAACYAPAAAMDFSGYRGIFAEVYYPHVEASWGGQILAGMNIFFTSDAGDVYTNSNNRQHNANTLRRSPVQIDGSRWDVGWTKNGSGTTGFPNNMTAVTRVMFRLVAQAAALYASKCYVRKLWLLPHTAPIGLISYDDLNAAQYSTVYAALQPLGIPFTIFPSSSYVGGSGKCTLAQVQEMDASGLVDVGLQQTADISDILINHAGDNSDLTVSGTTATFTAATGVHQLRSGDYITIRGACDPSWNRQFGPITVTSTTAFTFDCVGTEQSPARGWVTCDRLTAAEIISNIHYEQAYWAAAGVTRGLRYMAYSGGQVDEYVLDTIKKAGIVLGRSAAGNSATPMGGTFLPLGGHYKNLLNMPSISMDNSTAATVLASVDIAELQGTDFNLHGHNVGVGASSTQMDITEWTNLFYGTSTLRGLIQRWREGRINLMSYSQFDRRIGFMGRGRS